MAIAAEAVPEVDWRSAGRALQPAAAVPPRRLPYPYRAMLAICSDLDLTPNRDVFLESTRYLNTTAPTRMGQGLGLEVGNTIYFDMPASQFSYWNTDDRGRALVRDLIRSGHIDCLHSFGDFAITRAHAARALDELSAHGCALKVWIDHSVAPSNFGADIMRGQGDVPGSPVYHADLTCAFGINYVWRGRVTSMIGQEVAPSLARIFQPRHPAASVRTLAKELVKTRLGRRGHPKYGIHGANAVLQPATLRNGHATLEFLRCNPHWAGVGRGETADGMADVLTERLMARLIEREATCILYTHLGKVSDHREPFQARTRAAFANLAQHVRNGTVLVTTTRRLLDYHRMLDRVTLAPSVMPDGALRITLACPPGGSASSADLSGLTLYVSNPERTRIFVGDREVTDVRRNPADRTGRQSISLPWNRLEFPSGAY